MSTQIKPSDSYARFLVEPSRKPAPKHIKKLLPKYRITHFLGAGGFADVYEGTDENGWGVAIKVPQFKMEKTMDASALNRFASEADIWKKLQHENIVTVYNTGAKPIPHIVMELMDEGDLESLMRNHELSVGESIHIMIQILEGISYAHRMASVHRDLKPENTLFTLDGEAKITDWGIGKYMASEGLTKTLDIKGTLAYSAPEQFDAKEYGVVDWQTDIFQLGIVFYEMLTGVKPFDGKDMAEIMGKVLRYEPEFPSEINPKVPKELDEIVMAALEKYKDDRWESVAVMLHELKLIIKGQIRLKRRKHTSRKIHSKTRRKFDILNELEEYISILEEEGIDISNIKRRMKPIDKYVKLRWDEKVKEEGNILLNDLKKLYRYVYEKREMPVRELMNEVRVLFENCMFRNIDVEELYVQNNEAMEAFENRDYYNAKEIFSNLITELESILFEDDRKKAAWDRFDQLIANDHVLPPEGIEDLIEDYIHRAEEALDNWEDEIHKAEIVANIQSKENEERKRREKDELIKIKKEEKRRKKYNAYVKELAENAKELIIQSRSYNIKIKSVEKEYNHALKDIKKSHFSKADKRLNKLIEEMEGRIKWYEIKHNEKKKVKMRKNLELRNIKTIIYILIIVLLVICGISVTVWYFGDSDGDGIRDADDEFPDNPRYQKFDDLNFKWVEIIPGTFFMGSPEGNGDADEHPQHKVNITKGFEMSRYEITQAQWDAIMDSNLGSSYIENNPMIDVSWDDCQKFISKLNEIDPDFNYRLPTEAEWEYCCRANSNTKYSFGDDESMLERFAWYHNNSGNQPQSVGKKTPNDWGLYNMHGNVWEWCQDRYDNNYYSTSQENDPQGPSSGSNRVLRGGGWYDEAFECRSANRRSMNSNISLNYGDIGLRLVRTEK